MPYKSRAQAAYFNIHRKELEAQGVNVGEWNAASKGKKLPARAAAGGEVEPEPDEFAMQRQQALSAPPRKDYPMERDLTAAQTLSPEIPEGYAVNDAGQIFDKQTGQVVEPTRRPSVLPLTKDAGGQYELAMPKMLDIAGNLGGGWAPGAGATLGAGMAFTKKSPPGKFQFQGDPFKPQVVKPEPAPKTFNPNYDLHPGDIELMTQTSGSKGTGPGGVFFDHADNTQWYIKTPHDPELALNEKLAAELYKKAGVNVADTRLTELNGQPAIASRMIEGKQFSEYPHPNGQGLKGLQEGFPADVWLANGDAIGAGMENPKGNIIFDKHNNAYRIDFGGAMRFGGLGGLKSWWGPKVKEFETFKTKNKTMSETFWGDKHQISTEAMHGRKQVAQNIANITDQELADLVAKWGPRDGSAMDLLDTLMARRNQVAQYYGVKPQTKPSGGEPGPTGGTKPIAKPPVGLMNINKTHSIPQIFDAIKHYDPNALGAKQITAKQKQNIAQILQNYHTKAPESFVDFLKQLPNHQQSNIQSWMGKALVPQKPLSSELADMVKKLKNDPAGPNDAHDLEQAMQFFHQFEPQQVSEALLDAQLTSKQLNNLFTWIPSSMEKAVDDGLAPGGQLFEKTFSKALQSKKNPNFTHEEQKHYDKFLKQMQDFAELPFKSPAQREADRIKGGFTQQAFTGRKREKGIERTELRSQEVFHVPPEDIQVAQAYAAWHDAAHKMDWWKPDNSWEFDSSHATMQKVWLDTRDYVIVDAKQGEHGSYGEGNYLAAQAAQEYKQKYGRPAKGAIVKNTHDMPGGGPLPSGRPITTIITWDKSTRRSAWARFDPKNFGQEGLHLGIAGTMIGGWALVDPKGKAIMLGHGPEEEGMARGGSTNFTPDWVERAASKNLFREGLIKSSVPGRTDKHPMSVPAGAYVLPADIPSALGQGNTAAGGEILKKMFTSGPFGIAPMRPGRGGNSGRLPRFPSAPRPPRQKQEGGEAEGNQTVPIITAGGEYIVHPDVVRDLGGGSMTKGHKLLDEFVLHTRREHIKILKKLPGPKK